MLGTLLQILLLKFTTKLSHRRNMATTHTYHLLTAPTEDVTIPLRPIANSFMGGYVEKLNQSCSLFFMHHYVKDLCTNAIIIFLCIFRWLLLAFNLKSELDWDKIFIFSKKFSFFGLFVQQKCLRQHQSSNLGPWTERWTK